MSAPGMGIQQQRREEKYSLDARASGLAVGRVNAGGRKYEVEHLRVGAVWLFPGSKHLGVSRETHRTGMSLPEDVSAGKDDCLWQSCLQAVPGAQEWQLF